MYMCRGIKSCWLFICENCATRRVIMCQGLVGFSSWLFDKQNEQRRFANYHSGCRLIANFQI